MKAVIMAAGKSTRTAPLTLTRPKPLLPILNRPILSHQLDSLTDVVDEAIIIVGYMKEQIQEAFGPTYKNIRLTYVVQEEQLGTGHAVLQCADHIDGPFLALNGDDLYDAKDLKALAGYKQAALAKKVGDPRLYGIYEVTEGNRVVRIVEKSEEAFSNLANVGAYIFTPAVFDILASVEPSSRGEIELTCAIQTLAEQGAFHAVEMKGYWLPVGYPWHLLTANEYFLNAFLGHENDGDVSPNAHVNGRVTIGEGTVIRSGVVIDGPVCIGRNCTIGPNCWLRPGTTLGNGAHVGHAVELKNTILFEGAAVPHLSYVGDSIIGEKTNFGAGTITANLRHDNTNVVVTVQGKRIDSGRRKLGAIVGDHVHTGINTCIYPGRMLWPHTMTFPGEQIRRHVTETTRDMQRR